MRAAVVVGFGVTGRAVTRALVADGYGVVVVDDRRHAGADVADAAVLGAELIGAPDATRLDEVVAAADVVVVSPGIPVGHPVFSSAGRHGVEVVSEIELAARRMGSAGRGAPRLVAITGTNGKTTVTTLVRDAMVASGRTAVAAGNIGLPLVDAVADGASEVVVAEVSSFQLQFTDRFHPAVSGWLNLAADHLDWHPSHDHYREAKARIWANQGDGDVAVVNADDPVVMAAAGRRPAGSRLVTFSGAGAGDWYERAAGLWGPDGAVVAVADLPRALPHDRANALAAAAIATAAGATPEGVATALRRGAPLPHRVTHIGTARGVAWYDDSKATTPASVLAAVAGFASVVLIAGGRNKGLDLGALRSTVPPVRAVVAIGEAAPEVEAAFAGAVPVVTARSMAAAVDAAAEVAAAGDAVILSPGCTSFDWYRTYAERGDDFAALVAPLLEKERPRC